MSDSRKIGDGQRGVGVEVVRFYEALKQIPTHRGRLIGAQRRDRAEAEAAQGRACGCGLAVVVPEA